MKNTQQMKTRYQIPRKLQHQQFLFGLDLIKLLIMAVVIVVAFLLLQWLSGPPRIIIPLVLVGVSYLGMTQEIDGETYFYIVKTMIRDVFHPSHHLWEEVQHDRLYQRFHWIEREVTSIEK